MSLTLKVILIISITVVTIIGVLFIVIANHFDNQVEGHLLTTARAVYDNIVIIRKWVSDREGVFVIKQAGEEINPFLAHPELKTIQGQSLVMRNPALVTRELSELSNAIGKEFSYHLASLNYINPKNKPDDFEKQALIHFEMNKENLQIEEFYHYQKVNNSSYFRYFAPLYTEKSCLSCHADQGYQLGDVRGGISILLPAEKHKIAKQNHLIFFISTGLVTVVFLCIPMFFAIRRNVISPLREIEISANKIHQGNYEHKLNLKKTDEIGSLSNAFEEMRKKIKDYTGKLSASEKKYRSIIEHSLEAVAIVDQVGQIIDCNRILSKLTGYEDEQLRNKNLYDLFDETKHERIRLVPDNHIKSEHFETRLNSKDGLHIPVEIYKIAGFSFEENKNLSFVYIRDLTERKKIEKFSLQAEKMYALGQLSSGIAHEIRNPLFSLNNNLEYLKDKGNENNELDAIYPEFQDAITRIEKIVSTILDYSKPHELMYKEIRIEDVIQKALLLVQKQFEKSEIKIQTEFDKAIPEIEADPHKLEQVFINLFINAFQAMRKSGRLKISAKSDKQSITLRINDNGKGMSSEEVKRIFDPFFSKTPNGTGLGMSIVQRILEQHKADYWIESDVGIGTTFFIVFHIR